MDSLDFDLTRFDTLINYYTFRVANEQFNLKLPEPFVSINVIQDLDEAGDTQELILLLDIKDYSAKTIVYILYHDASDTILVKEFSVAELLQKQSEATKSVQFTNVGAPANFVWGVFTAKFMARVAALVGELRNQEIQRIRDEQAKARRSKK
jgi:hypothetical protein